MIFCDTMLPMGLQNSCQASQRVTHRVAFAFNEMGCKFMNYIDDLVDAEALSPSKVAFIFFLFMLQDLDLTESLEKGCSPATTMTFLEIQFDTIAANLTVLPVNLRRYYSC